MSGNLNPTAIKINGGAGDTWNTPPELWEEICRKYFGGSNDTLDPCPFYDNPLRYTWSHPAGTDGLSVEWDWPTFINPPFSDIMPWVKKATSEIGEIVFLVPVRTDQPWWHDYTPQAKIVFIRGRVNYVSPLTAKTTGASFPSCLLIFGGVPGVEFWWPECHKNRRKS